MRKVAEPKKRNSKQAAFIGAMVAILAGVMVAVFTPVFSQDDTPMGTVTFYNSAGAGQTTVKVEIADEPYKTRIGLMNREQMPQDHGMLFVFEREEPRSFWMKNTPLPLDIIYIDARQQIVNIYHNTTPDSRSPLPSQRPAKYVVEVNAGFCNKHQIKAGGSIKMDLPQN